MQINLSGSIVYNLIVFFIIEIGLPTSLLDPIKDIYIVISFFVSQDIDNSGHL